MNTKNNLLSMAILCALALGNCQFLSAVINEPGRVGRVGEDIATMPETGELSRGEMGSETMRTMGEPTTLREEPYMAEREPMREPRMERPMRRTEYGSGYREPGTEEMQGRRRRTPLLARPFKGAGEVVARPFESSEEREERKHKKYHRKRKQRNGDGETYEEEQSKHEHKKSKKSPKHERKSTGESDVAIRGRGERREETCCACPEKKERSTKRTYKRKRHDGNGTAEKYVTEESRY